MRCNWALSAKAAVICAAPGLAAGAWAKDSGARFCGPGDSVGPAQPARMLRASSVSAGLCMSGSLVGRVGVIDAGVEGVGRRLDLGAQRGGAGAALLGALAQQAVEHRRQEDAEEGHAKHAGEHGDTHRTPHLAAGTAAEDQRDDAGAEGDGGHQDGAQPQPAGLDNGVVDRLAVLLQLLGEFDDQDRVLARQADQHDERHLREDV
mmetsp:Transcript_21687/g.84531  ORF Transcript_21687/g.84531 Transcript_21687/m.84531 type:complete len:206 (-) Transcript_21687:1321-1938(-)